MIPGIFITTILPNGIGKKGEYLFSLCIDLNKNLAPDTYNPAALTNALRQLKKVIDGIYVNGFRIKSQAEIPVPGTAVYPLISDKVFSDSIRNAAWNILFETPVINKAVMMGDKPPVISNLIPTPLVNDGGNVFYKLRTAMLQSSAKTDTVIGAVKELHEEYEKPLNTLIANLNNIKGYSEEMGVKLKENYYRNLQRSREEMEQVSVDTVFDIASLISENPIMQRITGFTIDFSLQELPSDTTFNLSAIMPVTTDVPANSWNSFSTSFVVFQKEARKAVLLKAPSNKFAGIYGGQDLVTCNHDKLSKTDALAKIFRAYKNAGDLDTPERKAKLIAEIRQVDTSAFTRGLMLYQQDVAAGITSGFEALEERIMSSVHPADVALTETDLIKGHRYAVKKGDKYYPLAKRECRIKVNLNGVPEEPVGSLSQEFALNTDTGMGSFDEGTGEVKQLLDSNLLAWSGENLGFPTVFANMEDDTNNEPSADEGGFEDSSKLAMDKLSLLFKETFFPWNIHINAAKVKLNKNGVSYSDREETKPLLTLEYHPVKKSNPKLQFGQSYEVVTIYEYKNGWGLSTNTDNPMELDAKDMVGLAKLADSAFQLPSLTFKRNEAVKHVSVFLTDPLYETTPEKQTQLPGKEGESLHHLVIRNKGEEFTKEKTARHILPPAASFEHAFWHGEIFKLGEEEGFKWYQKYHDPAQGIAMREFYAQPEADLNYLPDPLCKGFELRFYLDKEKKIPAPGYEPLQYFFYPGYPNYRSCQLVVEDDENRLPKLEANRIRVIIRVSQGEELFVEMRTLLHPDKVKTEFETYGNPDEYTSQGKNFWLTPPLDLRITHATKTPLIAPAFTSALLTEEVTRPRESTFAKFAARVGFEQLNLYKSSTEATPKYIPDTLPTGEMELYAKWEEYSDDPNEVLAPDKDGNIRNPEEPIIKLEKIPDYSKECKIEIDKQLDRLSNSLERAPIQHRNEARNYTVDLQFNYDIKDTRYLVKNYQLRNMSSFSAYYPAGEFIKTSNSLEVSIPNNKKPAKPSVNKIIPLLVREDREPGGKTVIRESRGNRFRIYLNRGRLTSGKNERLGILLWEATAPNSYTRELIASDAISITGRDITADLHKPLVGTSLNKRIHLQPGNFNIADPKGIRNYQNNSHDLDLQHFEPEFVSDFGCLTYLPRFDKAQQLWYVDVEMNIRSAQGELHCPFIQLSLVHYQKHSVNHNNPSDTANWVLAKDCRISEVEKSPFIYLLPERIITVTALKNKTKVKLECENSSLVAAGAYKKTVFYAAIQRRKNEMVWETAVTKGTGGAEDTEAFTVIDPNSTQEYELTYDGSGDFRLVVIETEAFNTTPGDNLSFSQVLENKNNRVIFTNIFNV